MRHPPTTDTDLATLDTDELIRRLRWAQTQLDIERQRETGRYAFYHRHLAMSYVRRRDPELANWASSEAGHQIDQEGGKSFADVVAGLEAENARLRAALNKSYGALNGCGIPGLLERAAEVLEVHAQPNSRSILAVDLRAAIADLSSAMGVACARCGEPAALIPVKPSEDTETYVCKPCARLYWAGKL